jgi:hypothetical protein
MKKQIALGLFFLILGGSASLFAQSGSSGGSSSGGAVSSAAPPPAEQITWPQWAKDFRRADIIAFGVFPFAWFFTSIAIDLMRSAEHDWQDQRYYPWPLAPKDAVPWSNGDYTRALGIAAAAAISVALIDFVIIKIRRKKTETRERAYTPNPPVIKRTPFAENGGAPDAPGPAEEGAPPKEGQVWKAAP